MSGTRTGPRFDRLPTPEPEPECGCPSCRALAIALDADVAARRAVRDAAEAVDRVHRLAGSAVPRVEPRKEGKP